MSYEGDGKLPVIYVRGFAMNRAEIDRAVDDPFYGFSQGSVHVRVDGSGDPKFHQFESPLLRLVGDHGYKVPVHGDQMAFLLASDPASIDAATIWIHRFYDGSASTLSYQPQDYSFDVAASKLFELIKLVLEKTGAPKVFLVAHSMGGLICRSLLQKIIPEATANEDGTINRAAGADFVARVFTYATPHGGIHFALGFGMLERLRDATGYNESDVFGDERMYSYLTPKNLRSILKRDDFEPAVMPEDGFPVSEMFCLVGTNPDDYDVALGLSSRAVGARSDGLVQMEHAAVKDAPRAVVHRSHSGRYGIVNSEEGYQNLQRFLFGDLRVEAQLSGFTVGRGEPSDIEYQLDVGLAIRGLPVLVHEQSAAHYCPIRIEHWKEGDPIDSPVPLLTTFLSSAAPRPKVRGEDVRCLRHALKFRLLSITERDGRFFWENHLEQTEDWQDTLLVDIEPPSEVNALPRTWAAWTSTLKTATRDWEPSEEDLLEDLDDTPDRWVGRILVPKLHRGLLGQEAGIQITAQPRVVPL